MLRTAALLLAATHVALAADPISLSFQVSLGR